MVVEQTLRHFGRYQEIIGVLIRNGLGVFLFDHISGKPIDKADLSELGQKIRLSLTQLGPTFVKIGQFASTRPDLLPDPIVKELALLQDQGIEMRFDYVQRTVEQELGKKLSQVFREFNPDPIASASIGQVHYAVLHSGEKVVVKVQRPGLDLDIKTDIEIMHNIAGLVEQRIPKIKRYKPQSIIREFSKWLEKEIDYVHEKENAKKLFKVFEKNNQVIIPRIHDDLSTKKILTMSYIDGVKLNEKEKIAELQIDKKKLAQKICKAMFEQILKDGVFHGDPHPGNIFILPGNRIAFVDFGIVGEISPELKKGLKGLMSGIVTKNPKTMIKGMGELGLLPYGANEELMKELVLMQKDFFDVPLKQITLSKLIVKLSDMGKAYQIKAPANLILLAKTLSTLEGVIYELDPTMSIANMLRAFRTQLIQERFPFLKRIRRISKFKN